MVYYIYKLNKPLLVTLVIIVSEEKNPEGLFSFMPPIYCMEGIYARWCSMRIFMRLRDIGITKYRMYMRKFVLLRDIGITKHPYSLFDQFCGISNIAGKIVFLRSRVFPITTKDIGHIFLCGLIEYRRHFLAWIVRGATLEEEAYFLFHTEPLDIINVKNERLQVRPVRNPVMKNSTLPFTFSFFDDKGGEGWNHSLTVLYGRPEAVDENVMTVGLSEELELWYERPEYAIGIIYYKSIRVDINETRYQLRLGMLLESKLVQEIDYIKKFGLLLQSYQESIFEVSPGVTVNTEFLGNEEEESIFEF